MKSIIYVNYSPYENSGKIFNFLLENFENVFLFSLGFYYLGHKTKYNELLIFKKGKLRNKTSLFQIPTSQRLVFLLLPLRSIIIFFQILWYTFLLKKKYGKMEIYFSVNGFTSWIGIIMQKLGLIDKTVFWVWDYYPQTHGNKIILLMRKIYWYFDKISSLSNKVVFINKRIMNLRQDSGIISKDKDYPIIPIGTDIFPHLVKRKSLKSVILGFIGVVKKSQGLGIVFDNAEDIIKNFPTARFEVIGSGPDEDYFKSRAKNLGLKTYFYGYLEGESFNDVLAKCTIGIATYVPDPSNVSHYGDPGKVKRYLSLGLPVIITDVFEFSKEIDKYAAGVVINYYRPKEFVDAIKKIISHYKKYQQNALKLNRKFYYKKIYPSMFQFK